MFTIPSLRAKECTPKEKDALNILFVATPLLNVILPFVWKSFPFIFCADVVTLVGGGAGGWVVWAGGQVVNGAGGWRRGWVGGWQRGWQ